MRKFLKVAALVLVLALAMSVFAGCGKSKTAEETYFFTYDVLKAEKVSDFDGIKPTEGKMLLAVTVSIENTFGEDIPMFDTDFQVQWGPGDDDFAVTLEASSDKQLPESYTLADKETRKGILLYEVPADLTDFTLAYLEFFDDQTTGDFYEIAFQAK